MVKNIKLIKCFIASPSDVADERSHVKKIIETLNPVFMERGLRVEPIMWENNAIPAIGGDAQEIINAQLKPAESDIVIGIFGTRLGSPTPRAESGTAEEIRAAVEAWKAGSGIHLQVYFSNCPVRPSDTDNSQLQRLQEFKASIRSLGCLTYEYESLEDFEAKVQQGIMKVVDGLGLKRTSNLSLSNLLLSEYEKQYFEALSAYDGLRVEWVDRLLQEIDGKECHEFATSISSAIPVEQLIVEKYSAIIRAPELFGLTTLARRLCVEALRKHGRLWVYLDFEKIGASEERIIKNVSEYERRASRSASCIILDSWTCDSSAGAKAIEILERTYPKKRLIIMYRDSSLPTLFDWPIKSCKEYKNFRLLPLPKNGLRAMVEISGARIECNSDVILEKIVNDIDALNIHRTPLNCLTLLKVAEKSFDKSPANRTKMLETLLIVLFNLNKRLDYGTMPDATDCEHILGVFCEGLMKGNRTEFIESEYFDCCKRFCETKGLRIDYGMLWRVLSDNSIIVRSATGKSRFKSKFWISYFAAKRMKFDPDFREYMFSEKRYAAHPEVIEYYTGIDRNNSDVLELLLKDLTETEQHLKQVTKLPQDPDPYRGIKWSPKDRALIELSEKLQKNVANSTLPQEIKDLHADKTYDQNRPYFQSMIEFMGRASCLAYIYQLKGLSRALRNTDYADIALRKKVAGKILSGWCDLLQIVFAVTPCLAMQGAAAFIDFQLNLSSDFNKYANDQKRIRWAILLAAPENILRWMGQDLASDRITPVVSTLLKDSNSPMVRCFAAMFLVVHRPEVWDDEVRKYIQVAEQDSFYLGKIFTRLQEEYRYGTFHNKDQSNTCALLKNCLSRRNFGSLSVKGNPKFARHMDSLIPNREQD